VPSSCTFVVLHWRGLLRRFVLRSYLFAMSGSTREPPITIVVVSKRHGGCANGVQRWSWLWLPTCVPGFATFAMDGSAEGGERCLHPYEKGGSTWRLVLVVRERP